MAPCANYNIDGNASNASEEVSSNEKNQCERREPNRESCRAGWWKRVVVLLARQGADANRRTMKQTQQPRCRISKQHKGSELREERTRMQMQ
jgi:hypothetical protein